MSMTFGQAIEALKQGQKVQRAGWNGKGMWLILLLPGAPDSNGQPTLAESCLTIKPDAKDTHHLGLEPCIAMRTAQGRLQPGWLASQADMLAEDWSLA